MKNQIQNPIDELKSCLSRQLEAYWSDDMEQYRKWEKKILEIEKYL